MTVEAIPPCELLDVIEAILEPNRPATLRPDVLADLADLLAAWHANAPVPHRVADALLDNFVAGSLDPEHCSGAPQVPPQPPLSDAPAHPPWRIEWSDDFLTLDASTQAIAHTA